MAGWGGELWKSSGCKFQTTSLRPGDCQTGAPFNFRLSPNWSRYVKSSSDTNLGAWRAQSVTLHPSYTFLLPQMYKIERVFVDTRKRKRRTSLEGAVRAALESYFIKCPKPNTQAIKHISDDLGLERDVSISSLTTSLLWFTFCWLTLYFALGRWYVFGFATGDRRGSAWLCRWMRNWKASCMSRVLPPFPVRPTQGPVSLEALLPRSTCLNFPGLMSWNKPWILEWLGTQLDKAIVQPEPQIAFQKCAQLAS